MSKENKSLFGKTQLGVLLRDALLKNEKSYSSFKNRNKNKKFHAIDIPDLPAIETLGNDGVDYLRVGFNSKTDLGKSLSPDFPIGFTHDVLGKFLSIQAFWIWIRAEERTDDLRNLSRHEVYKYQQIDKNAINYNFKNYKAVVMDACYRLIVNTPEISGEMKGSVLPFDMVYMDKASKKLNRPSYAVWYIYGLNEIRNALKEDRLPDFVKLMDDPTVSISQCLESLI